MSSIDANANALAMMANGMDPSRSSRPVALSVFEAAQRNRLNGDWQARTVGPNVGLYDMATLNARARQASRDDWSGASMRRANRRNVIGTGITPRSRPRMGKDTPKKVQDAMRAFAERADLRFARWARNKNLVDREGRKNLRNMLGLQVDESFIAGNGFIVISIDATRPRHQNPLVLQMFEVEQLAKELDTDGGRDGNRIQGGVEIDDTGRPIRYWVHLNDHPLEKVSSKPVAIDAGRVLHLSEQSRVGETLGVTRLSAVLVKMWRNTQYDGDVHSANRKGAFLGMSIETDAAGGPFTDGPPAVGTGDSGESGYSSDAASRALDWGSNREVYFEPGMLPVLNPGEKINTHDPQQNGADYNAYMPRQIAQVAAGAGFSASAVSRSFTEGSYGSIRAAMLDDWKEFDSGQLDVADTSLRPIWQMFHMLDLLRGNNTAPGFFEDPELAEDYLEVEIMPPPRDWIDPAKDSVGMKIKMDYLMTNHGTEANRMGQDWRENFREIHEQRELAKQLGFELPQFEQKAQASSPRTHGANDKPGNSGEQGESPRTQSAGDGWFDAAFAAALRDY